MKKAVFWAVVAAVCVGVVWLGYAGGVAFKYYKEFKEVEHAAGSFVWWLLHKAAGV